MPCYRGEAQSEEKVEKDRPDKMLIMHPMGAK